MFRDGWMDEWVGGWMDSVLCKIGSLRNESWIYLPPFIPQPPGPWPCRTRSTKSGSVVGVGSSTPSTSCAEENIARLANRKN